MDAACTLVSLFSDIPVFPTVTAVVTLEKYEEMKTAAHKFLVPRDYRKVIIMRRSSDQGPFDRQSAIGSIIALVGTTRSMQ